MQRTTREENDWRGIGPAGPCSSTRLGRPGRPGVASGEKRSVSSQDLSKSPATLGASRETLAVPEQEAEWLAEQAAIERAHRAVGHM